MPAMLLTSVELPVGRSCKLSGRFSPGLKYTQRKAILEERKEKLAARGALDGSLLEAAEK
jgi:hypothetical protein